MIPIPFNCSNKKFPMFFSKDFACPTAVSCLLMGGDAARHASPVSKGALDSPGRRWWFLEQAFSRAGWMECSARMECLSTLHGVLSLEGWSLILRHELALIQWHYNFIADLSLFNVKQIRDLDIYSVHCFQALNGSPLAQLWQAFVCAACTNGPQMPSTPRSKSFWALKTEVSNSCSFSVMNYFDTFFFSPFFSSNISETMCFFGWVRPRF